MHLKYCFKILLGKLNLKYYLNCIIYVSKILKDNTEIASWLGIMIFLYQAVGKGTFFPTYVFICILHSQTQPASWNKKVKYMKALAAVLIFIKTTAQIEYYTALEEIEHIFKKVADPIAFTCQKLDNVLTLLLKSKISAYEFSPFQSEEDHLEEFPTLLHCAARFGLKNLATFLLNCPEATRACKIANKYGDDPASIAEKHGHRELRKLIKELSVSPYAFSYVIYNQGTMVHCVASVGILETGNVSRWQILNKIMHSSALKAKQNPGDQYGIGSRCQQEAEADEEKKDDVEDSREETEHEDQEEEDSYNSEEEHPYTFMNVDESVYDFILAEEEEEEKRQELRSFIMNRPPAPAPRPMCSPIREENIPYIVQVFQQKTTRVPSDNNRMYCDARKPGHTDTVTDSTVKHNIPAEQEELIHLQEQVKKGAISMDEALERFKQWQNEKQRLQSTQQKFQKQTLVFWLLHVRSKIRVRIYMPISYQGTCCLWL
uniref:B cell scaffold protein with ankyrin repeats 1 n=1 Tax=Buteo japonicus TaxID=224669 RepID=A0A8C0BPE9_9AVES